MTRRASPRRGETDLADTLDRVLDTGAVVRGDLVICVADIDLLYVDLALLLSSVETALESKAHDGVPRNPESSSDTQKDAES